MTLLKKLESYHLKITNPDEAWYHNPSDHRLPTLPDHEALLKYHAVLTKSVPESTTTHALEIIEAVQAHRIALGEAE